MSDWFLEKFKETTKTVAWHIDTNEWRNRMTQCLCVWLHARWFSADSAAGADYQINSLIYTGPWRQEFNQSIN